MASYLANFTSASYSVGSLTGQNSWAVDGAKPRPLQVAAQGCHSDKIDDGGNQNPAAITGIDLTKPFVVYQTCIHDNGLRMDTDDQGVIIGGATNSGSFFWETVYGYSDIDNMNHTNASNKLITELHIGSGQTIRQQTYAIAADNVPHQIGISFRPDINRVDIFIDGAFSVGQTVSGVSWASLLRNIDVYNATSNDTTQGSSFLVAIQVQGNTVIQNFTAGTQTFIVPAGVTSIAMENEGGAGAGAAGLQGGGGGASSYSPAVAVTPGESLTVITGAGATTDGNDGVDSQVLRGATVLLLSKAGGGGNGGGHGGLASQGVGVYGFNGGTNDGNYGGAGGAGRTGAGAANSGNTGGAGGTPDGGRGADGKTGTGTVSAGSSPGGGGSCSDDHFSAGGDGMTVFTYTVNAATGTGLSAANLLVLGVL